MTGKEFLKILKKNGWKLDRIKGSHHILIKGDKTLSIPVHGSQDLPSGILNKLLKEAGIK
jgi:predicted RNA binding protein YcfA (HicA-like mRNA interferase family)